MKPVVVQWGIRTIGVLYGLVAVWLLPITFLTVVALLGFLINPHIVGVRKLLLEAGSVLVQFGGAALACAGLLQLRSWGLCIAGLYSTVWISLLLAQSIMTAMNISLWDTMPLGLLGLTLVLLLPAVRKEMS